MTDEPITGTAVEEPADTPPEPTREIVPAPPGFTVTPQVQASELVDRLAVMREAMQSAMTVDVDYGVIPGTDKPALYKPGSEKLAVLFQLDVQLDNEKTWGPGDHLTVSSHATVYHAPTGSRLGYGEGLCTTRERKYAYRKQERTCPSCGAAAVIKGKAEFGGGWVCWKKRDGCGANFKDSDGAIENQPVGEVENPDLPDLWNTVVKMAEKRARVDAVLAVTGASALFSQDTEDTQTTDATTASAPPQMGSTPASDAQKGRIRRDLKKLGLTKGDVRGLLARVGAINAADPDRAINELFKHQASELIEILVDGAVPSAERPSDVPEPDAREFTHEAADATGTPLEGS